MQTPLRSAMPQAIDSSAADAVQGAGRDVVDRLRADIVSGHFRPSSRLKFANITERYKVGVGTVREALSHLVSQGFVTLEANKGYAVAPVSIEELREVSAHYIELEQKAFTNAMARGGDEWEANIVFCHHKLRAIESCSWEERVARHSQWVERHRQFHESLVSACDGTWLLRLRSIMFDQMERYRFLTKMAKGNDGKGRGAEHRMLMEAALDRDAESALRLVDAHVQKTAKRAIPLLAALQKQE